jgi:hypothetical protein
MRAVLYGSFVFCLSLAWTSGLRADDSADTKPVLDKALKAMGGEDKVARLKTATGKGKISGKEGGQELTLTFDGSWKGLDHYRLDAEVVGSVKALMVINGDKGWARVNGKTEDAPKDIVPFIQNIFYSMRSAHLLPALRDKAFTLAHLGEVKVGDRAAIGMSVTHKDRKDISIFFDKDNGLPLKTEIRLTDPANKEITVEYLYSDYKDFDGIKHPGKVTIKADGKEFTMELSELKAEETLDDSLFTKP